MPDYYEILGLAYNAGAEEVKAAFHRMAKSSHPDLNPSDATSENRFKEINQAYETLIDPKRRAAYNLELFPPLHHAGERRSSSKSSRATSDSALTARPTWGASLGIFVLAMMTAAVIVPIVFWLKGWQIGSQSPERSLATPPLPKLTTSADRMDVAVKGWIGANVQDVTKAEADTFGWDVPHGAKLGVVVSGSPAEKAGLKLGDIIVSIDRIVVDTSADVDAAIIAKRPGTEFRLQVLSGGRERRVTLTHAERPNAQALQRITQLPALQRDYGTLPHAAPSPVASAQPTASVTPALPTASCDGVVTQVGNEKRCLKPQEGFKDCPDCPEMVMVAAGKFRMGLDDGDADDAKPVHNVTIATPFAAGKFEVTFAEWDACVSGGGCKQEPYDQGWGRDKRPVINVSWDDAKEYVAWLSKKTGKPYRLLSEAEWEYAARAGTTTRFYWGDDIGKSNANCNRCGSQWDGKQTAPVGSFKPNAFGLYDMHGNVWQWVEDCYHDSYTGAPQDGTIWTTTGDCSVRIVRAGSWVGHPIFLRAALRVGSSAGYRDVNFGFRLARTLNP